MRKPETTFKIKVQADLNKLKFLWHFKTQEVCVLGIPDILICFHGWFIAYELKIGKPIGDPLQEYHLKKIRISGGIAKIITPKLWPDEFKRLQEMGATCVYPK